MGRKRSSAGMVADVSALIDELQYQWSDSKEPDWKLEVSVDIISRCASELEKTIILLNQLSKLEAEELALGECMQVTKQSYILFRLAEKLIIASEEQKVEQTGKRCLMLKLDQDEYDLFVERFLEFL